MYTCINAHKIENMLLAGTAHTQDETTQEEPAPEAGETPAPIEAPAPSGPTCDYSGLFAISPNHWQCGSSRKYLSYIYPRCEALRVSLLSKKQLSTKPKRSVWVMNGSVSNGEETPTTIRSYMREPCGSRDLQGNPGVNLRLGFFPVDWVIRPRSENGDCYTDVALYSPIEDKYLTVNDICSQFTMTGDDFDGESEQQLFKLTKFRL
jgi:hypothetical protein